MFRLANADAEAMADILGDLFNLQQQGDLYVLKPRDSGQDQPEGMEDAAALGTDLTLVPDQRQSLSITVDNRTNALLVSGTPTYLDLVAGVVEKGLVYIMQNLHSLSADQLSKFQAFAS